MAKYNLFDKDGNLLGVIEAEDAEQAAGLAQEKYKGVETVELKQESSGHAGARG
jgi:hypothetical protein